MILVTQLFSKVENVFAPRENEIPAFSNFSAGLKSAFEIKSAVLISAEFGRYLLSSAIKFNSSVSFLLLVETTLLIMVAHLFICFKLY